MLIYSQNIIQSTKIVELEIINFSDRVIVSSNCNDSVDFVRSKIEMKHHDSTLQNCTWAMFAPTGSQIILNVTGNYNKHSLSISNGILYTDKNLFEESKSSVFESPTNVLRIQYTSITSSSYNDLIVQYKTTGKIFLLDLFPLIIY